MHDHLNVDEGTDEEEQDEQKELMRLRKEIAMIQWNGDHDKRLKNLEKMMKKVFRAQGRNLSDGNVALI
jgi:metallophosphoesterase superfamily enzyme